MTMCCFMTPSAQPKRNSQSLLNERGATMLEYSLMAASICLVCVGVISMVGTGANEVFIDVGEKLAGTEIPDRLVTRN